jgi:hypothetical protein
MKMTDEEAVLRKMGVDFQSPAPGCCGMAGSFGFDEDKYDISVAVGELELLPAIRRAPPDALVIADGFSCREQISQCTDRHALHLAEVIKMALDEGPSGAADPYPEQESVMRRQQEIERSMKQAGFALGAAALGGVLLLALARRR